MNETITIGMVDPLGQIVHECAYPEITQKSVALTYAFAIRQEPADASFKAANDAIRARWGDKGLTRVKNLAWAYVEGRKSP